jgi:uncharacterized protein (DUF1684 family)
MVTPPGRIRSKRKRAVSLVAGFVVAASVVTLGCERAAPGIEWNDGVVKQIEAWRAKHEAAYRRDWATIEGLHFLTPGVHTAGSATNNDVVLIAALPARIGRFTVGPEDVTFEAEPFVGVTVNDRPPEPTVKLRDDDQDETDEIKANGVSVVVHKSGERIALRVRDPRGERAKAFRGFDWFPISRDYRVSGRFIRDSVAHEERVVNTFGDIDSYVSEGVVEFTLGDKILRLRPFTTQPRHLYIVFSDETSGNETYEAARFLTAELRDDGTTTLDFNEAYNPPCAFNPFTTCPIPLQQNRLHARVLAGEKKYPGHVEPAPPTTR